MAWSPPPPAPRKPVSLSGSEVAGKDVLYFHTRVRADELEEASEYPPTYMYTVTGKVRRKDAARPQLGVRVEVNKVEVAVFMYLGNPIAVDAACPHMGGPIELGDIEDVDGEACVTCPWHSFSFDVATGACVAPKNDMKLGSYPCRVEADGSVSVGFVGMSKSLFDSEDF